MKRTLSTLSVALLLPGMAFSDTLNVTFINPAASSGFWSTLSKTMVAAANDLDISVTVIEAERNPIALRNAAQQAASVEPKPDYVVTGNALSQGHVMYNILHEQGIPVIFIVNALSEEQLSGLSDASGLAGSIEPDNEMAGYEMGRELIEAARQAPGAADGIQILALLGDSASPASILRENGLKRAVSEAPDAEIVRAFPVNWSREEAQNRTSLFLNQGNIDAVWSANDDIALGAKDAAEEKGLVPGEDIFFVGLNWSLPALQDVEEGSMVLTHGGHFFSGAWAMVMLRDIAEGHLEPVNANLALQMSAVRQADAADLYSNLQSEDFDAIDFREFSNPSGDIMNYSFTVESILAAVSDQ